MTVRVRFAPSPTGPLHMGGIRTAFYNYLFAKRNGGEFILRIEDTDQNREVRGAEQYILDALQWCGIEINEGPVNGGKFAPYRQSERKEIYRQYADRLIDSGNAYYAFDTPEELEAMRERLKNAGSASLQYDGSTRDQMKNSLTLPENEVLSRIANGEHYVIRARIPVDQEIKLTDLIRGEVTVNSSLLDDKVLFKSDGMPTYHLANVVDDYLMKITHVIRGEEWLPSAPLHFLLYRFFGWEHQRPQFAHLPLILRPDGNGKLSKRDGDRLGFPVFPLSWKDETSGEQSLGFKERGFFSDAFVNMVALMGWAPPASVEVMPVEDMVKDFSLDRVHKAGAKFDFEKAKWFNHEYMKLKSGLELAAYLKPVLAEKNIEASDEFIARVCDVVKLRSTLIPELWENGHFFFTEPVEYDRSVLTSKWNATAKSNLDKLEAEMKNWKDFTAASIDKLLHEFMGNRNIKAGDLLPLLRIMLIGSKNGPAVYEIISLLGKEKSISRMKKAMSLFDEMKVTQ